MQNQKKGLARIAIDVDPALHKAVKVHCAKKGVPYARWLREQIRKGLKRERASYGS